MQNKLHCKKWTCVNSNEPHCHRNKISSPQKQRIRPSLEKVVGWIPVAGLWLALGVLWSLMSVLLVVLWFGGGGLQVEIADSLQMNTWNLKERSSQSYLHVCSHLIGLFGITVFFSSLSVYSYLTCLLLLLLFICVIFILMGNLVSDRRWHT